VAFGTLSAVDNPARQAFVQEVVGRDLIRNAVTLNSTAVNVARVIGPTIAPVLVGTVGIGWCFVVKAASFGFVIASLLALDTRRLHPVPPVRRGHGQLRAGLRYAVGVSAIIRPLLMMALVGTFTFEFEVSRPVVQHGRSTPHPGRARLRDRRRPPRGGSHAGHRDRRVHLDRRGQRHVLDHGQLDHPARLQS
jgi:MFS family permease